MTRHDSFTHGNATPYPLYRKLCRFAPTGIRSPNCPARNELLYRLRCNGPCYVSNRNTEGTCKLNKEVISYLV